jgi:hypothetical protein
MPSVVLLLPAASATAFELVHPYPSIFHFRLALYYSFNGMVANVDYQVGLCVSSPKSYQFRDKE